MRKELEDKLFKTYPKILGKVKSIECEDGWYDLINTTCNTIQDKNLITMGEIKKDNGLLSFHYYESGTVFSHFWGILSMAAHMSAFICEICGNSGKLNEESEFDEGAAKVRCSQHRYIYNEKSITKKNKGAVSIDFDGVINSYKSGFVTVDNIPDPPNEGAFEAIKNYLNYGFKVYIYSTRNECTEGKKAIKEWLLLHGLEKKIVDKLHIVSGKPISKIYIDDRGWHFSGKFPSVDEIKYYRPWHGGSSSSQ